MFENIDTKLVGYLLLIAGLAVMAMSAFSVFSVFRGSEKPFELFNFPSIMVSTELLLGSQLPAGSSAPKIELLPGTILSQTTNVVAHMFLMGFLVTLGARVSQIGVYLLRPVVVKLKSDEKKAIQTKLQG